MVVRNLSDVVGAVSALSEQPLFLGETTVLKLTFANVGHRYTASIDGEGIASAFVDPTHHYIRGIVVSRPFRRQGVATQLLAYIARSTGKPLNKAPEDTKNRAAKLFSSSIADTLGPEVTL